MHLLTSIPIIAFKIFNLKTRLILRISGYPKLNFIRKNLWKNSDIFFKITCPTYELLNYLKNKEIFDINKIYYLPDAIINIQEFIKKKNTKLDSIVKFEKYFLSIGRFTKQKNFKYLIKEFKKFSLVNKEINLLVIGDGEEKEDIKYSAADVIALAQVMAYDLRTTSILISAQKIESAIQELAMAYDRT